MQKIAAHYLSGCLGLLLMLASPLVFAQTPEQIYRNGKQAFDQGNYLMAVKWLFAYQQLVRDQISPALNNTLSSAIQYCDEQISFAIRTKEKLDKYGHITEVVIEASGKADTPGAQKTTRKYHKPAANFPPKPSLPSKAPKAIATEKPPVSVMQAFPQLAKPPEVEKPGPKTNAEELQQQLTDLTRRYQLLQNQHEQQTETYNALREKYTQLLEKYQALLEARD